MYQISNGTMGERRVLSQLEFAAMLIDTKQKNGFVVAVYEFSVINEMFRGMKTMCQELIRLIDNELAEEDN